MNGDPWTFTEAIKIYNWESHPDWYKCPINPEKYFEDIRHYYRTKECFQMVECKRMLYNYKCLGYDSKIKQNYFIPSEEWQKDKFYPVELGENAKNLYRLGFPNILPVMTHCDEFDGKYINKLNTWKIFYLGGSDTGSFYVETISRFNKIIEKYRNEKYVMMTFPEIYINNPPFGSEKSHGLLRDNVSNFKL